MNSYSYKLAGQQNTFSLSPIEKKTQPPIAPLQLIGSILINLFANQPYPSRHDFHTTLSYVRLIKDKVNAKIQNTNLKSSAFVPLSGIAKVQKKGKAEMKKMAAPINSVFLNIL